MQCVRACFISFPRLSFHQLHWTWSLPYRQIITRGEGIVNLSAYGNKQLFQNCQTSVRRALQLSAVPPLANQVARMVRYLPKEVLAALDAASVAAFTRSASDVTLSDFQMSQHGVVYNPVTLFCGTKRQRKEPMSKQRCNEMWSQLVSTLKTGIGDVADISWDKLYLTFLRNKSHYELPQAPHTDYNVTILRDRPARRKPWFAVIPTTKVGSFLYVWNDKYVPPQLVHIPWGCAFLLRGDVVHAGGLPKDQQGEMQKIEVGATTDARLHRVHLYLPVEDRDVDAGRTFRPLQDAYVQAI